MYKFGSRTRRGASVAYPGTVTCNSFARTVSDFTAHRYGDTNSNITDSKRYDDANPSTFTRTTGANCSATARHRGRRYPW